MVTEEILRRATAALNDVELARARRLIDPSHGNKKVVSQWATREILSAYLDVRPDEVALAADADGKPYLERGGWHFNLSHSGDWALLGVSRRPLGIDVEDASRDIEFLPMARRFFSRYEAARVATPLTFFQIWTLKEAYVKAEGKGLRLPLDDFRVLDDAAGWGVYALDGTPLAPWTGLRLEEVLRLPPNYNAALVCPDPAPRPSVFRYEPFAADQIKKGNKSDG